MYTCTLQKSKEAKCNMFRKVSFIILIVFCLAGVGYFVFNNNPAAEETIEIEPQVEVTIQEYYIAQVPYKTYENDISFTELQGKEIATFSSDVEKVKMIIGEDSNIQEIDGEDTYTWLKEHELTEVIIVPFQSIDHRLKTLSVEGNSLLDRNASDSYSLLYSEIRTVDEEDIDGIETTNYDSTKIVTYMAGGEVIPARAVARKFNRTGDFTFPFHNVQELFVDADVSSIIMENSISGHPEPCYGCTWFKGDEDFIEGLTYLGIDVLGPGNHMGDGGHAAIGRMIEVLDEAGIGHTGVSMEGQDDASKPAIVEVEDFQISFLGYDDVAYFHWAGEDGPGVATLSARNSSGVKELLLDKVKHDITRAKEQSDFVVVLISWGDREYVNWALDHQKEMGHTIIDAGADMIIGSHQHWVGEIEFYGEGAIYYGLGNFVFDQTHTDPTRQGAFLDITFYNNELISSQIIPHQSCGPQQSAVDDENCSHFQPYVLEEDDPVYKIILDRMWEFSEI